MIQTKNEDLEYIRLTPDEQKARGILGRLVGICADFINPTRNGRAYTEELWRKVFDSDIMKEKIANKVCFGELGHPADREEIDPEKACVCLSEQPAVGKDGKMRAVFDILDTPCGRVLKTLCDYGSTLGVSSRGTGDVIESADGPMVDPDTYNCECFDIVLIPAVKEARLKYVTESLERKRYNKTLKESLEAVISKSSKEQKKLISESLSDLGIDMDGDATEENDSLNEGHFESTVDVVLINWAGEEIARESVSDKGAVSDIINGWDLQPGDTVKIVDAEHEVNEECNNESCSDKEVIDEGDESEEPEIEEVDNVESDEEHIVEELQEALNEVKSLRTENLSLKNAVSVCNAKDTKLQEQLLKYKKAVADLSDTTKDVRKLRESIINYDAALANADKINKLNESRIEKLHDKAKSTTKLVEELTSNLENANSELASINEELATAKKDAKIASNNAENYKKSYAALKEHYLEVKASSCGLSKKEVVSKLKESYKVSDVDSVCEELQERKSNISKLPFKLTESTVVSVKPTVDTLQVSANSSDDDVSSLLNIIG